jgi:hypothetical protein
VTSAPAEPSIEDAKLLLDKLKSRSSLVTKISSTLSLNRIEKFYVLIKNDEAIGWLELGSTEKIKQKRYDTIKIIYVLPEFRNTFAVGAFLIALKKNLQNPLILGSDSYGGVLFKDGLTLVKKMHKGSIFDVRLLNLKTGEISDFIERTAKDETIIFENTEFPLTYDTTVTQFYILEGCESENL